MLERLGDADARQYYLDDRRKLRARPDADIGYSGRKRKQLKGDLKANMDIGGIEMNDYDVQSLHIPYGPGWDARRIDKLVYQTVSAFPIFLYRWKGQLIPCFVGPGHEL